MQKTLTLIVPIFNEEEQIRVFLGRATQALQSESIMWRILFVDDGSTDGSLAEITRLQNEGSPIDVVIFSRNFGKEAAITAGFDYASGDVVLPIDVDLQDPPELIPDMLKHWREGADIVLARRRSRSEEGILKRVSATLYYRIMSLVSNTDLPRNVGDFRLLDARVVQVIRDLRERTRYMKGLLSWPGFRCATVTYDRSAREGGVARQSASKLFGLAFDGIISFTSLPLRVWSAIGLLVATLAMLYMLWIVTVTLLFGRDVPGYASLMSAILFMGGLQLLSVGVLGEYIARIFTEVKARPIYVVSEYRGQEECSIMESTRTSSG